MPTSIRATIGLSGLFMLVLLAGCGGGGGNGSTAPPPPGTSPSPPPASAHYALAVSPPSQSAEEGTSAVFTVEIVSREIGEPAAPADLTLDVSGSNRLFREDKGGTEVDADKIGYYIESVDTGEYSLTLDVGADVPAADYALHVSGEAGDDVTIDGADFTLSVTARGTTSPTTIVTHHVIGLADHAQSGVPVSFGQVFKAGDVPGGATLDATLGGEAIPLQVDVKATNADGSLRHAVLTARLPALPADADLPLTISTDSGRAASGEAVGLSQLLATGYDATFSATLNGMQYTADARALLQAAAEADVCKPWGRQCNQWLSGPLVSAWIVNGPVTAGDGTSDPNLRVYFAVRGYADARSHVERVRTDVIVENTAAYTAQAQPQYTATLASGSATYTSPALTQYTATRWHKVLWWNDDRPQAYVRQDTHYIQKSRAVSRYMDLTPDEDLLAGVRQSCPPLAHCDQTKHMGNTGAQAAIGPLPRWTSVYILDPDVRAYRWMLADTDALGAYGIHYRDEATGRPLSIQKHPYVTIADWSWANRSGNPKYKEDLLPNCVDNDVVSGCSTSWYGTGNPYAWDNAHQPAEGYVAYMVTGSYYYLSELAFGASHNELWPNESYRGHEQGLVGPSHGQIRGKAWVLREMVNAAWLLPDDYPLKAEFNDDVNNSIANFNAVYTDNPDASPLGLPMHAIYPVNGHEKVGIAPWQHDFLTWSAGHAAELGFAGAADFRDWLAAFEIGVMTDWENDPATGYCWLNASVYKLQVEDAEHNWLPSLTAMRAATFPTLSGLECNSGDFVAGMADLTGKPWQAGKMSGYPYSATGFPANFQIGIATAADTGLPKAHDAWETFKSRSVKPLPPNHPAYNDYPNFAVVPRSE